MMNQPLEGKVILITGAAQGLGFAMARGCAESGAQVVMADINIPKLENAVAALCAQGLSCEGAKMDVTDLPQIQMVMEKIAETYGRLDGLVNNAGITSKIKFLDSTVQDFDKVMALNLRSTYLCCKTAADIMVKQGGGSIVNIASVAARTGGGLMSTSLYAASKGGVLSLTKGLARELAPYNVRVNAIAPGSIDTPMTLVGRDPEEYAATIQKMPLHRRGQPEELVGPVVLLLSDAGSFMVGATLDVNGGSYMY